MSRTTKKALPVVTLAEAQDAARIYVKSSLRIDVITAHMNQKIEAIKQSYQPEMTRLQEAQKEPVEILHAYAEANKDSWDKKSLDLLDCIIGFRTGTPKVTKQGKTTWDFVLGLVKKAFPALVRTKEELNKEALIQAAKDPKTLKKLQERCFVDVVQEESFFVDVKKETVAEVA